MTNYLLDTDICIFILREKYNLLEKIEVVGVERCYVSEITLAELHFGAHYSTNYEQHRHDVHRITSFASVIPISDVIELYGRERARLQKLGTPIADFDLLIATTAVQHNMVLVTNNTKHHARVTDLRLENWVQPV
jgi:tRNA(fMet)-specific endonuclease VapC